MSKIIIPNKKDMEHLGQRVYTDGKYAYKFDFREKSGTMGKIYDEDGSLVGFNEVVALERVKGVRGCQQIVGFIDDVLVTELIPGSNLAFEGRQESMPYTDAQLESYFRILVAMGERGVDYDQKPKNIMFHLENGFTPIDYMTFGPQPMPGSSIMLFPILDALSQQEDYGGDPVTRAVHYNRILEAFHEANPEVARQTVLDGFDPKSLNRTFYKSLDHGSEEYKKMDEIFQEKFGVSLENAASE